MSKIISIPISDHDYARLKSTCGNNEASLLEEAGKIFHAGLMTTLGISWKEPPGRVKKQSENLEEQAMLENVKKFEQRGAVANAKVVEDLVSSKTFKSDFKKMLEADREQAKKRAQNQLR